MNLETINVIKQLSSDNNGINYTCYSGLLSLLNKDRIDIIKNIRKLKSSDPSKYTPELFAYWLKDPETLIKRYDKLYNSKTIKHEYNEAIYEEKKMAFSLGESEENPDN